MITEPIVWLPSANDPVYMKKVLDSMLLPRGVLVPMVNDANTARQVVESTRYPHLHHHLASAASGQQIHSEVASLEAPNQVSVNGVRGCAIPFIRATGWGHQAMDDYLWQCQGDLLVMVQVETVQGVEQVAEIAQVTGVDAIFLGPFDLSCSIPGKIGQMNDPVVQQLLLDAENKIRSSSRPCLLAGFKPPGRSLAKMFQEAGYSLVCGSVDLELLRQAALMDLATSTSAMYPATSRKT